MAFKQDAKMRSHLNTDTNYCLFNVRVFDSFKEEWRKTRYNENALLISFRVVNNPSRTNYKVNNIFKVYAWGNVAQKLLDTVDKGYGIFVECELNCPSEKKIKTDETFNEELMFEIKRFYVSSLPRQVQEEAQEEAEKQKADDC